MTQKRFKKLLRAERFDERIIDALCFAVKESGGRVSYEALFYLMSHRNESED